MKPIFYQNPVPLSADLHQSWSIKPVEHYHFARNTNSVYLMAVEFVQASREYPIFFSRQGEEVIPIVLLGVDGDDNRYLLESGHWNASYIPAYVRRYPFIPAIQKEDEERLMVCIDQEYSGLYREGEHGMPLFEEDGSPAPLTQQAITLLQGYHGEHQRTIEFGKQLDELGLLEEARLDIERKEGKQQALTGFHRINPERFLELDGEALIALRDSAALEWIYAHFQSLDHVKRLL